MQTRDTLQIRFFPQTQSPPVRWRISEGLVPYPEAVDFMESEAGRIAAGEADELVWLVEHPPLYTAGTSAKPTDLVAPNRFPVHATGRGGEYTYHGPGQRVAYVLLDLKRRRPDVRAFVSALEAVVIATLESMNVTGERREDRVGRFAKPLPERGAAAIMGEREEVGVIVDEAAKGSAQDLGQGEVIGREEGEADKVEAVLHTDMVEEDETVSARDGEVLILKGADEGIEKDAALAHKDEDVFGPHRALLPSACAILQTRFVPDGFAAMDHGGNLGRDIAGEAVLRRALTDMVQRGVPGVGLTLLLMRGDGPEVDAPGLIIAFGPVGEDVGFVRRQVGEGIAAKVIAVEDGIDEGEDFRR